jgi:hypothetical protein
MPLSLEPAILSLGLDFLFPELILFLNELLLFKSFKLDTDSYSFLSSMFFLEDNLLRVLSLLLGPELICYLV